MNYRDALAWLYGAQTFGIKLGLDNTRRLLAAAGNPHERLRFIHMAGTNGKGSVCAMLDSMLREAGLKSALYTSPHLVDFRERIQVEGRIIPEEELAEGLGLLRDAAEDWDHAPTFFEIATVLAAWCFARAGAEIVVWETGMGGRLDATNTVTPLVSVITPIGMDHCQWLGGTIAEIAGEKAGIIKPRVPVVAAAQCVEAQKVLEATAAALGSPIHFVDTPWQGPLALAGEHQRWNAALACAAIDAAGLTIDDEARRNGLANVAWPGRFQRVDDDLVIDGAHNVAGCEVLVRTWREVFGTEKANLVFGAMHDKDARQILQSLRSIADTIWLVPVAGKRAATVDELRVPATEAGFTTIRTASVGEALNASRAQSGPVVVAGSLFLAGEVLALLGGHEPPTTSDQ